MLKRSQFRRLYMAFLRGMSANKFSMIGVILTTSAFLLFILFEFSIATGWVDNAYLGLISFLALPAIFMVGLVLIPFGWWVYSKKRNRPFLDLFAEHFSDEDLRAKAQGARVVRFVALLTVINVIFLGVIGTSTIHYMEGSKFCGTACHGVMGPEWATYQKSPHSQIRCVECHVGEGTEALIDSKLNGAWQMVSASFNLYDRPIHTPVHNLRPARDTCEECHWPEKFHGNRISNRISFKRDSTSTPMYTTLMLKIGSGHEGNASGSHWHVAEKNSVRYVSAHDKREEMIWVEVLLEDGTWKRYTNTDYYESEASSHEDVRVMDCVDCHNRVTHIYKPPGKAIDSRMALGEIDRTIPFIKRKAMDVLMNNYPDKETGLATIEVGLRNYYLTSFPELFPEREADIDEAIATIQAVYERNIHPNMNIGWGAYPSHLGHQDGPGCFRCHDTALKTETGESIPMDCTLCHSILADESAQPFAYLKSLDMLEPGSEKNVQSYFQDEFWEAVKGQHDQ
jgi:hypothetical protein